MLKQKMLDSILIIIGSLIFGFGINYFIIANHLAEGGFTGISLILHYKFGWSVGAIILVLNIPLFFIAWRQWGLGFIAKTILGVVASSVAIELTSGFQLKVDDLLLAALYGGVFTGTGLGLVIRYGGTTGGADIIGRLAYHYFGLTMGRFYLIFDFTVLSTVALIYGLKITLYSLVTIFVFSRVADFIIEGIDSANQALIISNNPQEIAQAIDQELGRGFTYLQGKGGFTKDNKEILLCVVGKWQMFRLKKIIRTVDPKAFVIVSQVFEALGEGFKEDNG